jgi:hypothetical protein
LKTDVYIYVEQDYDSIAFVRAFASREIGEGAGFMGGFEVALETEPPERAVVTHLYWGRRNNDRFYVSYRPDTNPVIGGDPEDVVNGGPGGWDCRSVSKERAETKARALYEGTRREFPEMDLPEFNESPSFSSGRR